MKQATKKARKPAAAAGKSRRRAQPRATVILSAGAPNSPLMAGALAAIYERGKTFNVIFASGAGGLIGSMFVAPAKDEAPALLAQTVLAGIEEPLYSFFPIPFRSFFKPGPWTDFYMRWARRFQVPADPLLPSSSGGRLYNDLISFYFSAITPSTLNFFSEGLCHSFPQLDQWVDIDKLRAFNGQFFFNAFNITRQCMDNFDKEELDLEHLHAALSFPYVYAPKRIGEEYYFEGASVDPLNLPILRGLILNETIDDPGTIVLMDILNGYSKALIRRPRNLLDAYSISVFAPVVALAQLHLDNFEEKYRKDDPPIKIKRMEFDIPPKDWPTVLDWSHANLSRMWHLGHEAGKRFCDAYGDLLPDREQGSSNPKS